LPYPFPSLFVPPSPYSSKLNISTSKQALLKKNNELIVQVMERQKDAVAAAPDQTSEAATTVEVQGGGDQEEGGECKAGGGGGGGNTATSEEQKVALQQCAVMIKELNDNLTQVREGGIYGWTEGGRMGCAPDIQKDEETLTRDCIPTPPSFPPSLYPSFTSFLGVRCLCGAPTYQG